jgi:MPBQ/MSBQ methyltransferase
MNYPRRPEGHERRAFQIREELMDEETAQKNWDADYRQKGKLYGGSSRQFPAYPPGSRVLDIGCGEGRNLPAMISRGWEVIAMDHSPHAVNLARNALDGGTMVPLVISDAGNLPFSGSVFDAVTVVHVIGHGMADARSRIAGEISRVLRPGAKIFLVVFSTSDFRFGKGKETECDTFVKGNGILTHYFMENEVADLFPECTAESVQREEWNLRIRSKDHLRSEIIATFSKIRQS